MTHSSPANAEADALASVVHTLASTETADIDFMLQLLASARSDEDKRADLLLFRNQIVQCAAGEMYRIRAQQMPDAIAMAREALKPFALDVGAVSLSKALGHISREHLLAARDALAALTSPERRVGSLFPDIGSQEPAVIRDADDIEPQRMPEGYVLVPQAALDWLNGEKPDTDGKWFGECEDEATAPGRIFPRKFWWRSKFRELCALTRPECGGRHD